MPRDNRMQSSASRIDSLVESINQRGASNPSLRIQDQELYNHAQTDRIVSNFTPQFELRKQLSRNE